MPVDPSETDTPDLPRPDSGGADASGSGGLTVEPGTIDDTDAVADLWVALADGQRSYGTHLAAAENRTDAADAAARAVVTGGLVVARDTGSEESEESEESEQSKRDDTERGDDDPSDADATADPSRSRSEGVVGFVTFGVESGRYDLDVTRGVVYNLFVREPYRGDGVGSRLLSAAESSLADAGVDVIALEAMADNADARRFYDRHGYRPHRVELEKPVRGDGSDTD